MIEAGIPCGDDVALDSLDALMIFASDIGCCRAVRTAAGSLTAIQIQRRYLQRAVEHLDAPWMPTWAGEVCDHQVPGIDRIDEAVEQPPADGRAHVRGETIPQAVAHARRYSCTWDYVMGSPDRGVSRPLRSLRRPGGVAIGGTSVDAK